jgi:hypothetical protein
LGLLLISAPYPYGGIFVGGPSMAIYSTMNPNDSNTVSGVEQLADLPADIAVSGYDPFLSTAWFPPGCFLPSHLRPASDGSAAAAVELGANTDSLPWNMLARSRTVGGDPAGKV